VGGKKKKTEKPIDSGGFKRGKRRSSILRPEALEARPCSEGVLNFDHVKLWNPIFFWGFRGKLTI